MNRNLVKTSSTQYHKKAKLKIGFIMIAVLTLALILSAVFILPKLAISQSVASGGVKVVAIVPQNGGKIGVGAEFSKVFVTIQYSDGSTGEVALSELLVTGLDVTQEANLENVILDFGGFKQAVKFEVLSTMKTLEYVASTGGRIEGNKIQHINAGSDASTVVAIPDEGYRFVEWIDGNPNATRTDLSVSVSQRIGATFQKIAYTVVFFYPDGTTAREEKVLYNESATKVPSPTEEKMLKYGYRFVGWSESYDRITANTNIVPIYQKHATDLYLEYTKGTEGNELGTSDALTYYPKGEQATIRIRANPERTFTGWSILTYGNGDTWETLAPMGASRTLEIGVQHNNIPFSTSKTGTGDEYVLNFTPSDVTEEIRIRANFVYNQSTITFTSMSTKAHDSILVNVGEPIGDKINVDAVYAGEADGAFMEKIVGYTFRGWYIKNGVVNADGTPYLINKDTKFNAPTSLIAYWTKNIYDVNFLKGESENPEFQNGVTIKVYYQDPLGGAVEGKFPETIPYKANHTFKGWYLAGAGNEPTNIVVDKTYKIVGEVTRIVPVFQVNTKNLNVALEGSGTIKVGEKGQQSSTIAGTYKMNVTKDYVISFFAGVGYSLKEVIVTAGGNKTTHTFNAKEGEITINATIASDYTVMAYFTLSEYDLTVTNGNSGTSGSIEYAEIKDGVLEKVVSTDLTVRLKVSDGISKNIWISARDGYYINSIKINDNPISNIPTNASNYTVVLDSISADISIVVTYAQLKFIIELPEEGAPGAQNGTIEYIGELNDGTFVLGDSPRFSIAAKTGYYIKSLKINGMAIDPYKSNSSVTISNIKVNDVVYNGLANSSPNAGIANSSPDARITSYVFSLDNISGSKEIVAEYDVLYYNVKVTTVGVGSVNLSNAKVNYGAEISIVADTVEGYYVYSAEINGNKIIYDNPGLSQVEKITTIVNDQTVVFTFVKRTYGVNFKGSDATVKYSEDGNIKDYIFPKTIDCQAATNHQFTIAAAIGKKIDSVKVNGQEQNIAFNATSHTIKLDNISQGYDIEVVTSSITFTIDLFVSNSKDCQIVYDKNLNYGDTLHITIDLANGKSVDKSRIEISHGREFNSYIDDGNGKISIELYSVVADMTIYIPIKSAEDGAGSPYQINFEYDEAMGGLSTKDGKTEVFAGDSVTYVATPKQGYTLKYLIINGDKFFPTNNNEYNVSNVQATQNVQAIFTRSDFRLTLTASGNGVITANTLTYQYGEELTIRISADLGYMVGELLIGETGGTLLGVTSDVIDNLNNGTIDYIIGSNLTVANMSVEVRFTPKQLTLTVNTAGEGEATDDTVASKNIFYDEEIIIKITAYNNYFIDAIKVNGVNIDTATLGGDLNTDIQEYINGTLMFKATSDTVVDIVFLPNIYKVAIADAINGSVLVRTDNSNPSDGSDLQLFAGDKVYIRMAADDGYHISELIINGQTIEKWKIDEEKPNNNRIIDFPVENITGNLTIRVTFEINSYEVQTKTENKSVNFMQYDDVSSKYGTLNVYGKESDANNIFSGILHGSDIRFIISPVRSKGYYLSRFTITWVDPENTESNQTTTLDFTEEARKDGQVTFNVRGNLQTVLAEFSKETFEYSGSVIVDQDGSSYLAQDSTLSIAFRNPNASSGAGVEVIPIDGKYEYGLAYAITTFAGTGYTRTSFLVNGTDRNSAVRSDVYSGVIQGNIDIVATYQINTYKVDITENTFLNEPNFRGKVKIYGDSNEELWSSGGNAQSGTVIITNSGKVTVFGTYLQVTHNTRLRYQITPANETNGITNGYMIAALKINGAVINIANPDAEANYSRDITRDGGIEVALTLHSYSIKTELSSDNGGARVTVLPDVVDWGTKSTIELTINPGYLIKEVYINGVINPSALDYFIHNIVGTVNDRITTAYELVNIRTNTTILFVFDCVALNVEFSGGYNESFDINGEKKTAVSGVIINENTAAPKAHFSSVDDVDNKNATLIPNNGIITGGGENGAKFNNMLTFYFMPINGYKIANIEIRTHDLDGNILSVIDNISILTKYDEAKGYYKYIIGAMPGKVTVSVTYAVKTYAVKVTNVGGGASASTVPNQISHHQQIVFDFNANYGYHLEKLEVNGREILVNNSKKTVNNSLIYYYTTTIAEMQLVINDELINGKTDIEVRAKFAVNIFRVKISVENLNPDDQAVTLIPELTNMEIQYSANGVGVVKQNRSEGYSIKSIGYANKGNVPPREQKVFVQDAINMPELVFAIGGEVMDTLNYHSSTENVLYIYYYTAIDTHISSGNTYLFETGLGATEIPKIDGKNAFNLQLQYNNVQLPSDKYHNYFVEASLSFSMDALAEGKYNFAGFQERVGAKFNGSDWVGGKWQYVKDGVNGITLRAGGSVLSYTIKADRCFRAVVFRMYEVRLEVHPEFKYITGSNAGGTFDMVYRTYAQVKAKMEFDPDTSPNISNDSLVDTDGNSTNGAYVYRVYSGAKMVVEITDKLNGGNMNPTRAFNYFYISYNASGAIAQTPTAMASGAYIDSDKLVHAYCDNRTYVSFFLDTTGGQAGNEGANVQYFLNGSESTSSLSNGSLIAAANARVKVVIKPKANYMFDAILEMEAKLDPGPNGEKQFTGNWITVSSSTDGTRTLTVKQDAKGRITEVILDLIVTENIVLKMQFCKLIQLSSQVELIADETTDQTIINNITPEFTANSANGEYRYGDSISFTAPLFIKDNTWNIEFQFVGFMINGVNSYKTLGYGFPTASSGKFSSDFVLKEYNASTTPNGVLIVNNNNQFVVNVVARYVPVYNIIMENEYKFEFNKDEHSTYDYSTYFDPGQISYNITTYNMAYPEYYKTNAFLSAKTEDDMHTDKTFQALGKTNASSSNGLDTPNSQYNTWADNFLTLNWTAGNISTVADMYDFVSWQYYTYDFNSSTFGWKNIPYTDNQSATNKPTSRTFTFPISALFMGSYLAKNVPETAQDGYKAESSQYDDQGRYIDTTIINGIRIRPKFQRKISFKINREVYYEQQGIINEEHANDNPAIINENKLTTGTFSFYDVITLEPAVQNSYRFLGWYYKNADGDYSQVTNRGKLDKDNSMVLTGNVGAEGLKVRITEENYDAFTNTLNIYARYIKQWTITFQTYNTSGSSGFIANSIPYIATGTVNRPEGSDSYVVENKQNTGRQNLTQTADAGALLGFGLYGQPGFDPDHDKYESTQTSKNNSTETWGKDLSIYDFDFANSKVPQKGVAVSDSSYIIMANGDKKIIVNYNTEATLIVEGVYKGSEFRVPTALKDALGWNSFFVQDGNPDRDSDGAENGKIIIKGIPITPGADYSGKNGDTFGCRLPKMQTGILSYPDTSNVAIKFNGDSATSKTQTIAYYKAAGNTITSTITNRELPFSGGNGSAAEPYLVKTKDNLLAIDSLYVGNGRTAIYYVGNQVYPIVFKLDADINVGAITPLCLGTSSDGNGFNGELYGTKSGSETYKLMNISVLSGGNYQGLFSVTNGAIIRNITISGSSTLGGNSYSQIGILVGAARNTKITNVNSTDNNAKTIVGNNNVGGLVGLASEGTVITNCRITTITINGTNGVGGLVGALEHNNAATETAIRNSSTESAQVIASGYSGGGIVGRVGLSAKVSNCFANKPGLSSTDKKMVYVGGIAGLNNGEVSDCYITGGDLQITTAKSQQAFTDAQHKLSEKYGGGGIVGYNTGAVSNCYLQGNGTLTLIGSMVGGIVGVNATLATVKNCNTGGYSISVVRERLTSNSRDGGDYGGHVGYNNGTIENAVTNRGVDDAMSFSNAFISVKGLGQTNNSFGTEGNAESQESDGAYIYIGGIAGYNASSGRVIGANFRGKIVLNRATGNAIANFSYVGALAGFNSSRNNVAGAVNNSRMMVHLGVWADNTDNPAAVTAYLGTYAGNGMQSSNLISGGNNRIVVNKIGNGSYYSPWNDDYWNGYSASGYRTVRIITNISAVNADRSVTVQTTKAIPRELYTNHKNLAAWKDDAYSYSGNLRQVFES